MSSPPCRTQALAALSGATTCSDLDATYALPCEMVCRDSTARRARARATRCPLAPQAPSLATLSCLTPRQASDSQPPLSFTVMMWVVGVGLFACLCCCYQGLRVKQNKGVGLM